MTDDQEIEAMRQDAIKRLAVAMGIPEEILANSEGYHWTYGYPEWKE